MGREQGGVSEGIVRLNVVVDTNILFSILLRRQNRLRDVLMSTRDARFYCCRMSITELFKHKAKILKYSALTEEELFESLQEILQRLSFYDELSIAQPSIQKALELCRDVDEKDTPFVALMIDLDGVLWAGDREPADGLREKGFDRFFVV